MLLEDARRNVEVRRVFDFRSLLRFGRDAKKLSSQGSALTENGSLKESLRQQRERLKGL
jgi:hypothetical protein